MAAIPPYQSVLERFPEHAKALGMISIEMANLDIFLGAAFAGILRIPRHVGQQVYLTPRSAFGRLAVFESAIEAALAEESAGRNHLMSLAGRAKRILQKRHEMMHDSWGTNSQGVVRRSLTEQETSTPVPLEQLTQMVLDIRVLIGELMAEADKLEQDAASQPK